jgi:hypothetical protein
MTCRWMRGKGRCTTPAIARRGISVPARLKMRPDNLAGRPSAFPILAFPIPSFLNMSCPILAFLNLPFPRPIFLTLAELRRVSLTRRLPLHTLTRRCLTMLRAPCMAFWQAQCLCGWALRCRGAGIPWR